LLGSNRPSRSGALVNDDLLAKCLGELVGDDPRDDAGAATGRIDPVAPSAEDAPMIDFRIKHHSVLPGRQVVEVWDGARFLATITAEDMHRGTHLRINSKYMTRVTQIPGAGVDTAVVILAKGATA